MERKANSLDLVVRPAPVSIDGFLVKPKKLIRFLGLTISSDLSWKDHTSRLCEKIQFAANRIRVHGRFFSVKDKCLLCNGWIRGAVHANALVFLSFLK